jgi:hypothetical protein
MRCHYTIHSLTFHHTSRATILPTNSKSQSPHSTLMAVARSAPPIATTAGNPISSRAPHAHVHFPYTFDSLTVLANSKLAASLPPQTLLRRNCLASTAHHVRPVTATPAAKLANTPCPSCLGQQNKTMRSPTGGNAHPRRDRTDTYFQTALAFPCLVSLALRRGECRRRRPGSFDSTGKLFPACVCKQPASSPYAACMQRARAFRRPHAKSSPPCLCTCMHARLHPACMQNFVMPGHFPCRRLHAHSAACTQKASIPPACAPA